MAVTQAQVAQLYVALFNRAPEGAGFNAWVAAGATKTVAQMANEMLASPATPPYFASLGIDISTDRGYVENIYKNILGKDYSQDPDGINAWVRHLQLGNSRGDTLVKLFEVATSTEARIADPVAAQTFANKTAISQYAAQKIADIPTDENGAYDFSLFQRIIAQTNNTNLDAQKAAIDALVAPTVHNLSSDANNVSGTDKADLFNGAVSATVNQTTFKDTDKIDGKGGNDTLNLDMYTNFYGLATDRGEVKNIENLKLTNHTSGHLTFNARNIHDMQTISIDGSTYKYGLDIINPENKVKLNLKNIDLSQTGAQNLRLIYNTDVLAGTNDDQEVTVDNVKTGNNKINITTVNNDKVEAVTINALSGVNKLTGFISDHVGSSDDSSIKTIKVKGSAELEITGPSSLQTFDASAYTGNKLTANLKANGSVQHIIGSSQDDTFNVTGATGAIIPINGGAGRDVVNILNTISGNKHVEMSGVEELNIKATAAVLDFSRAQEIDTIGVSGTGTVNVGFLNSRIKSANIKADAGATVLIDAGNTSTLEDINIKQASNTTLTANSTQKLNLNVDMETTFTNTIVKSTSVKELNYDIKQVGSATSNINLFVDFASQLEKLKIDNKTDKDIVQTFRDTVSPDTYGSNLKIMDVTTQSKYHTSSPLRALSKADFKGVGDNAIVELVGRIGMPTDGRYPLQGTQDITLNAQNLKTLSVANDKYIMTTRDVSLTSTTDKEGASVTYGGIGTYDPYNAYYPAGGFFSYRPNNVTINANGQKTLTVADIHAVGDVNLTSHFTQSGSTVRYGSDTHSHPDPYHAGLGRNITGYIAGRNVTINHSAANGIDDGVLNFVGWSWAQTGNYTFNVSGYKTLNAFSGMSGNIVAYGDNGSINLNTNATVAGATAKFGDHSTGGGIQLKAKNLNINATAANGITDSEVSYGNFHGYKASGKATIKAVNQKSVDIGWLRGFNSADDSKKMDVDINLSTNISDATVSIGIRDTGLSYGIGHRIDTEPNEMARNVKLSAAGQKTFKIKDIGAVGDVDVNIKGSGLHSTAEFRGSVTGKNVNINLDDLSNASFAYGIAANENLTIKSGTNNYLQSITFSTMEGLSGKNVDLDFSNVIAPIYFYNVTAQESLSFKGYAGDDVSTLRSIIFNSTATDFTANIVNAKGHLNGNPANSTIKTLILKGGVTNPASIEVAGNNTDFTVMTGGLSKLQTLDLSGYVNASGKTITTVAATNIDIASIKGSATKDVLSIAYATNTKLKTVDTGAGDDEVTFSGTTTQTHDITVNLGEGNDTITTATLTANKKFEISGGAGNDKFKLAASTTTDNTASKYVTITDASRGDKIGLSDSVTGFVKTNANATSGQTDLKDAINAALASQGTTTANNIYAVYYGNETYLVRDADASKTLSAGDNLVKLAGLSNYDVLNGNVITDTDGVTKLLEITNA